MSFIEAIEFTSSFTLSLVYMALFLMGCIWTIIPLASAVGHVIRDEFSVDFFVHIIGLLFFAAAAFSLATLSAWIGIAPIQQTVSNLGGLL